jgi:hypothetical protein
MTKLCECNCGQLLPTGDYPCGAPRRLTRFIFQHHRTRNRKHGHSYSDHQKKSPTYASWNSMLARCVHHGHEERKPDYIGVHVCERWVSFENFLADMGERPDGTTLGRFGDVGDYEPFNCSWQTDEEQKFHARARGFIKPRRIALTGAKLNQQQVAEVKQLLGEGTRGVDIAKQYGISQSTVCDIRKGRIWPKVHEERL